MTQEIEVKFLIDRKDIQLLDRHQQLKSLIRGEKQTKRVVSTYLDTPQLALKKSGVGFRLRQVGDGWVQTVKASGKGGGSLSARQEFESPIENGMPDWDALAESPFASLFADPEVRQTILPMFVTDFERTKWYLELEDFTTLELAVDVGEIRAGEQVEPLCEMELELKGGNAQSLLKTAIALAETLPVTTEGRSKAARGYALVVKPEWTPVKGANLKLDPKATVSQGFAAMMRNCLEQVLANEQPVLFGTDIEGVHQFRVGLRRMRSLLSVFKPFLPERQREFWNTELRWLGGEFGPARDWDVFCDETLVPIEGYFGEWDSLREVREKAEAQRREGYVRARAAIRSHRYCLLILKLYNWLDREVWRNGADETQLDGWDSSLENFAHHLLDKVHGKFFKLGKRYEDLDIEQRHELRIRGKKVRYAAEFFASLYPKEKSAAYLKSLKSAQDRLGALNDAAVADELFQILDLGNEHAGAALIRGWFACKVETQHASFQRVWKGFKNHRKFWH